MNPVLIEQSDGVATVRMNRPAVANAIDLDLARELESGIDDLVADPSIAAIVLLGAGDHFCAGGDRNGLAGEPPEWAVTVARAVSGAIRSLHRSDAVVVAGCRGAVAGAGLSLALVADLVVAAPTTRFVAAWGRAGITPDAGGSWLLPRRVGPRVAAQMLLTDLEVRGADAVAVGLATEITETEEVDRITVQRAREAIDRPPAVAGRTAALLRSTWEVDLDQRLTEELDTLHRIRTSHPGPS